MADVKWIKLSTRMFDDEKIKLIEKMPEADSMLVIWVKLLSQAGKTNASGYIYLSENIPYTDEMLAAIFNRPLSVVRLALRTFRDFGMLEMDDRSFISIANWEKHQNIDGLEKIREQNRMRKQREREKKRLLLDHSDCHVTVTQSHATDIELELEEDKNKDIPSKTDANADVLFEEWWDLYDNKKGDKKKCRTKYKSLLKKNKHQDIMDGTKRYKQNLIDLKNKGEFAPNAKYPYTFLNGENFNDEYEASSEVESIPVSKPFVLDLSKGED